MQTFLLFHQFIKKQFKFPNRETTVLCSWHLGSFSWVTIFQIHLVSKSFLHLNKIRLKLLFVVFILKTSSTNPTKCKLYKQLPVLQSPNSLILPAEQVLMVDYLLYLQQVYSGEENYSFTNEPCSLLRLLPKTAFRKQTLIYYIDNYFSIL